MTKFMIGYDNNDFADDATVYACAHSFELIIVCV